ncbi:amino acid--[acyl-carrier-protein] ligase [Armatimonas rosea]|uniref:Seryl-tRNA synthetase n=1 Tax=Armatimonas rosea TaxID=685828 RepID=A0A7W9SKH9_ARMRO|nr:amino acid--[acyl-carrier-protein] ligase [Armatimonas rosea]MBB6048291.1 seryl-tRNA synthetase [Armatimonas rosea]
MSAPTPYTATAEEAYLDRLLAARLLLPTNLPGIYARGSAFTQLMEGLERAITRYGRTESTQILRCPPVLPRSIVEKCGYFQSFPNLLGCMCCFTGGTTEHEALLSAVDSGADLLPHLELSDVVLAPAACYYVYPYLTGTLPQAGKTTDIENWCYRHEPSLNPMRMRAFRMREFVHAGTPEQALGFRDSWIERAQAFLARLGLSATVAPADDPFFGAGERLMAAQTLKFELLIPIVSDTRPTAVMSSNYHKDHFGHLFDIRTPDGAAAHTTCIGFGMERIVLALLAQHGLQLSKWPTALREHLGLA